MELLCDRSICRLCGEENGTVTGIFPTDDSTQDLSYIINKYLPVKVENDRKYPGKICPGCNIQLEATKSFMDLIVDGQLKLRQLYRSQTDKLYRQEKQRVQLEQALQTVNPNSSVDTYTIASDETGDKFLIQKGPLFNPEHELQLRAEGLSRPRRKRGRPSKIQTEAEAPVEVPPREEPKIDEPELNEDGKRKRRIKAPSRYSEAIQGKELDKVFQQEGVDEDLQSNEEDVDGDLKTATKRYEEVIGRVEDENGEILGKPVVINKSPNRIKARQLRTNGKKKCRYQCEICGREFLHFGRYQVHKKSHEVEYKCTFEGCDFSSEERGALEVHQEDCGHSGLKATEKVDQYGVLELPENLNGKAEETTSDVSSNKKEFYCEECLKTFSCKQNYDIHLKAVHDGEKPYACEHCDMHFSYANSLKIHSLTHEKKVNDGSGLQFQCPSCPKAFKHPSSLQYHRDSIHTSGRRFVCNKCDKPFKHRQLLQRHQLVHSDERPHNCNQCSAAFKTAANLRYHTRTVHVGQRTHWCGQCKKSFVNKTALKMHARWHSGLRPFQCDVCQKAFSQKGNLAEHRRIHTGEKPYQCDHCSKAFTTSSQYRLHKKRHLDERPHQCEFCAKCFLNALSLKAHMRRHFDEKPHKCNVCGKTFHEVWALRKHERLHTGEKPHRCEHCGKMFADSSNLVKHRRTHRNIPKEGSLADKQMLYVTYEKEGGDAIVTYIEPQDPSVMLEDSSNLVTTIGEEMEELKTVQQLMDQEGNPISFTTQDGQQVKVVTSTNDGEENIQGLLPDGTLVPISVTTSVPEKRLENPEKVDITMDGQLVTNNIQLIGDNQNMCLVTTYDIEDPIHLQYLDIP